MLVKNLCLRIFASLLIGCLVFFSWTQPVIAKQLTLEPTLKLVAVNSQSVETKLCLDTGEKIDLNNANLVAFTDCPGFYPTLARLIVKNGPYQDVKGVLNIPELSASQKKLIKANLAYFTVTDQVVPLESRMPPRPAMRK